MIKTLTKTDRRNAYLYCKFRDEQYALYDEYAKRHGFSMRSLLIVNALYYAKDGMTQKEICLRTFNSKQTVSLIIKQLLAEGYVVWQEVPEDKRNKQIRMTEEGRHWCKKAITHITRAEDEAMAMFSPKEQEMLVDLSRTFTKNLTTLMEMED